MSNRTFSQKLWALFTGKDLPLRTRITSWSVGFALGGGLIYYDQQRRASRKAQQFNNEEVSEWNKRVR
jgi:hypothetical protein